MTISNLKECPFCAGEVELYSDTVGKGFFYSSKVECAGCGTSSGSYTHEHQAIESWNTRHISFEDTCEILTVGKLNHMTIALFKPKYEKLLAFVEAQATYEHGLHVDPLPSIGEEARELLKDIREDE